MPTLPYGAVYFRKSNPPARDWERDYATAAADGMNTFRHWFLWSAIEPAPGRYDWADYDRQFELAERHGLRTIVAELTKTAPEWVFRRLPHVRYQRRDGSPVESGMFDSSAVGGNPGVCLDNDDARALAGDFLRALAGRYAEHPAMGGYDVWNECNYDEDVCYCPATARRFREWLRSKYGDPSALGRAWGRYVTEWDDIVPPRGGDAYGDVLDWLEFRRDNAYALMRWRIDVIKSVDPHSPITAHGVAATFGHAASRGADDWRAAAEVDVYGLTFVPARHGDDSWRQPLAFDLVRSAARGKPFWYAEAQAGPLWMQPQVVGRARDDGRIATPDDIRYWHLTGFAHGAAGHFSLRWRPLLNGPLFGAFGAYGMDGSRTDRSAAVSELARWATHDDQADLWRSRPGPADIGIVYVPESQDYAYAARLSAHTKASSPNSWTAASGTYYQSVTGAWRAFFDSGIHADFVHLDDIADRDLLYLPFPALLKRRTVDALTEWVHAGGTLISEGCPAYFSDNGWAGPAQPQHGLAEVFGVRENFVEFVPDLADDHFVDSDGHRLRGGGFRQAYETTTGTSAGRYDDGSVAVAENVFGQGRTLLIGTHPGAGYSVHEDEDSRAWFASLLGWAGRTPRLGVDHPAIIAREHDGEGGRHLWLLNPTRNDIETVVSTDRPRRGFGDWAVRWGEHSSLVSASDDKVHVRVPARDGVVLSLRTRKERS
jgi:beta-galactosidase